MDIEVEPLKVVLATLNAKFIHSSLALRYLREYCKQVCPDMAVKEYSINNGVLDILSDIYREKPDVLGLACYIWNIEMTLELASLVKKVLPNVKIILGGPEVSYDPAAIMEQYLSIDYIIQGEGEEVLYKLLSALTSQKRVSDIPGLAYRQGNKIFMECGPQIMFDLDSIPFPYHDDDMVELTDKIIYYESSRGCPFSCQYCLSSATTGVRFFSLARVFRDLEFFIKHDVKQVKFVDRTFNARKEHYLPLLKFLAEQECRTNFHFEIAADILDDEVLDVLKQIPVGRIQFEIGIQSTHEPTLKQIRRHNKWSKIVDNVTKVMAYGNIHLHLDLIVGLPEENYSQFGQSFNDVYSLKPHMLQIGFLKMLKGSGIRNSAADHGYIFMDTAPYQVLANKYMSYGEIRKLHIVEEIFNQVYNSGRFQYSLPFFIMLHNENAFAFYNDLADYWEERNLHVVAHSLKALHQHLLEFCRMKFREDVFICQEFLKFDALVSERGAVRTDFLNWNEKKWDEEITTFWRDEVGVRNYLPDYRFTTWREIKKKYHIEVFAVDIPGYLADQRIRQIATPVLFCYQQNTTDYKVIREQDFWRQGGQ